MELTLYCFYLEDKWGNKWLDAFTSRSSIAHVYNLYDKDENLLHFESEAYHLGSWAIDNFLKYNYQEKKITINF